MGTWTSRLGALLVAAVLALAAMPALADHEGPIMGRTGIACKDREAMVAWLQGFDDSMSVEEYDRMVKGFVKQGTCVYDPKMQIYSQPKSVEREPIITLKDGRSFYIVEATILVPLVPGQLAVLWPVGYGFSDQHALKPLLKYFEEHDS